MVGVWGLNEWLYLQRYLSDLLQTLICCRTYQGLPVCQIWKAHALYLKKLWLLKWKVLNLPSLLRYRVYGFQIQHTGSPRFVLQHIKIWSRWTNTFGDMAYLSSGWQTPLVAHLVDKVGTKTGLQRAWYAIEIRTDSCDYKISLKKQQYKP